MIRQALRAAFMMMLAGGVLAGCASSKPVEPVEEVEEQPRPARVTPPPEPAPEPARRTDGNSDTSGNPVGSNGRPLQRIFYFDFDQSRLSQRGLSVLSLHAEYLRDFPRRRITIEGHCDERGTRDYNLALGERRAEAVRSYLTSAGVRSSQIRTVSFGEERPAATGQGESAWSRNRRAVLNYN